MMKAKRPLIVLNVLVAAILACNLPSSQRPAQPPGQQSSPTPADVALEASDTPGPVLTETPSLTPTITLTPTPSVPQVTVSSATNCRTGPGVIYDLIYTMQPGQTAEVIGKDTPDAYWIIKMPNGGNCWLWGQYATVTGNIAALQEWIVPPTPTPSVPANPSGLKLKKDCTIPDPMSFKYSVQVELTWVDNATNETGYWVFRDDTKIATLGADETSFSDTTYQNIVPPPGSAVPITYSVQAFNDVAKSKKISKDISCY